MLFEFRHSLLQFCSGELKFLKKCMKFVLSVGHDPVPFSVSSPFNLLAPN